MIMDIFKNYSMQNICRIWSSNLTVLSVGGSVVGDFNEAPYQEEGRNSNYLWKLPQTVGVDIFYGRDYLLAINLPSSKRKTRYIIVT